LTRARLPGGIGGVPEYDAFGREIGEDTLAGWRSGASPQPAPQPAQEPEPAAPAPSPRPAVAAATGSVTAGDPLGPASAASAPRAVVRAPRRRRRPKLRWVFLLVGAWVAFRVVSGVTGEVRDAIRDIDLPAVTMPTPEASAVAPTGLGAGSLLRPAAFERALAELRGREIGRIQSLRLAPERIDVSLLTRRGTLVSGQIPAGGELRRFSESGAGFGALDTIPYARIDTAAPRRLVRAAAERLGRPATRIDYLVATYTSGELTWGAYFKGGAIFLADARGRVTRRVS